MVALVVTEEVPDVGDTDVDEVEPVAPTAAVMSMIWTRSVVTRSMLGEKLHGSGVFSVSDCRRVTIVAILLRCFVADEK